MDIRIFISYSSADEPVARQISELLKKNGLATWFAPDDVKKTPSGNYALEIPKAIDACDLFFVCVSRDSLASNDVAKEVSLARGAKKRIIPVIITQDSMEAILEMAKCVASPWALYELPNNNLWGPYSELVELAADFVNYCRNWQKGLQPPVPPTPAKQSDSAPDPWPDDLDFPPPPAV